MFKNRSSKLLVLTKNNTLNTISVSPKIKSRPKFYFWIQNKTSLFSWNLAFWGASIITVAVYKKQIKNEPTQIRTRYNKQVTCKGSNYQHCTGLNLGLSSYLSTDSWISESIQYLFKTYILSARETVQVYRKNIFLILFAKEKLLLHTRTVLTEVS